MQEHQIRLRGGWEWHDPSNRRSRPRAVTLPFDWPAGQASPVRLVRKFGSPPLDPSRESLVLNLERVPGLVAVRFNDRPVPLPDPESSGLSVPLDQPRGQNELVLDVDPVRAASALRPGSQWGHIALVIRPV